MKITEFTQSECRTVSAAVLKALKASGIEEEYGIVIDTKSGSYSGNCYTFKVEAALVSEDGTVMSKQAEDFKDYCYRWDLEETDLNRTFTEGGETWTIVGAKPRSTKYPILCKKQSNGMTYKLPADRVKRALAA